MVGCPEAAWGIYGSGAGWVSPAAHGVASLAGWLAAVNAWTETAMSTKWDGMDLDSDKIFLLFGSREALKPVPKLWAQRRQPPCSDGDLAAAARALPAAFHRPMLA